MPDKFLKFLAESQNLRQASPSWMRKLARSILPVNKYNRYLWAQENPYTGMDKEWKFKGNSKAKIGIIFDPAHYHKYYMTACMDMGISYEVIDIRKDDWLVEIKKSGCNGFLVWPLITNIVLKEMTDERLRLLEEELKLNVYPPSREVWLLDNKRRVSDWLSANNFDQPETHSFFIEEEAVEFVNKITYPVVFKTIRGSVSHGVMILNSKNEALKIIKKCFKKGIVQKRSDPRNFQWDFVLFQEYLPDVEEKRMIRIGDSFICIDKVKVGDFHSGSGYMKWGDPGNIFLQMTKDITDKGNFKSMNVDFFVTKDDRILVNELHTLFHGPKIPDSNLKGKYTYDQGNWTFEQGNYYRNYCCNLRVIHLMEIMGEEIPEKTAWLQRPAF